MLVIKGGKKHMNKKNNVRPFSMKDKIGYTLGDLGCCFTEQYRAMYLSVFYTLILQVNPFDVDHKNLGCCQ